MKLIKLSTNSFAVRTNGKTYLGDTFDVNEFLVKDQDVDADEVAFAFLEIHSKGHNVANFGLNRTFIYTQVVDLGVDALETIERMAS